MTVRKEAAEWQISSAPVLSSWRRVEEPRLGPSFVDYMRTSFKGFVTEDA